MRITVDSLFATPLIKFKFTKHDLYNFPEIPKKHRKPFGWKKSLNTSFGDVDGDDFLSLEIKNNLVEHINQDLIVVFNSLDIGSKIKISELWYNVYHDNQGQEPHDHLPDCTMVMPFFCGIYYNKNASPTTFIRNDNYHHLTRVPSIQNSKLKNFFDDIACPEVTPGDIILFPPWVNHSVDTKNDSNMRLTFSFNIEYNDNIS
jgi:hypothetical protein